MFSRILVPLDGSELAEFSLGHAVKLARTFGASVHLLWVTELNSGEAAAQWKAQEYLSRQTQMFLSLGIAVQSQVVTGRPAEATLQEVRKESGGVIVLSTHGGAGRTPFPLSGMASKLLAGACTSVLIVPCGTGLPSIGGAYRTILAPVDFTEHARRSAEVAAAIARVEDAELVLVTAVVMPEVLGDDPAAERSALAKRLTELNRVSAQREMESLRSSLGQNLRARSLVIDGRDAAMALEALAESEDASLIVLEARGRTENPERAQGAVVSRLLERVQRPILVYREGTEPARQAALEAQQPALQT